MNTLSSEARRMFIAGVLAAIGFHAIVFFPFGSRWADRAYWISSVVTALSLLFAIALVCGCRWALRSTQVYLAILIILGMIGSIIAGSHLKTKALHMLSFWHMALLTLGEIFLFLFSLKKSSGTRDHAHI